MVGEIVCSSEETMTLTIPLSLLVLHFLGDFPLQSNWMALNKSKHWDVLLIHAGVYSLCFFAYGWPFIGVTFLTHLLTDAVTSRITSKLWFIDLLEPVMLKGKPLDNPTFEFARVYPDKRHWFFVIIGLDQLIHFSTLAMTYKFLFSGV